MIRRDYILGMIEECIRALARIAALKQEQRWESAAETLNGELQRLIGSDIQALAHLTETDLLARLMQDGPTHAFGEKMLILTTLLKEAGDVAAAVGQAHESQECYRKALHLLLETLARDEVFECPEFVPKVEMLKGMLATATLPTRTHAQLMQHYERTGDFAKAEGEFHVMLDAEPDNDAITEFGVAFYQRLLTQGDAALKVANLPRAEVEEGLKELQHRRK